MRTLLCVAIAAAVALLAGCGQLKVQVDVLDREYVRAESSEESLRQAYRRILAEPSDAIATRLDRKFSDYQREVLKLADKYDQVAQPFAPTEKAALINIAAGLRTSMTRGIPQQTASRKGIEFEALARDVRSNATGQAWNGRGAIPPDLRRQLVALEAAVKDYDAQVDIERRTLFDDVRKIQRLAPVGPAAAAAAAAGPPASPAAQEAKAQEAVVATVARRSIIAGSELSDTEFAHVVANAPSELWKSNYNRAFGSGTFGNIDVVIRMNSTADFSVKGLRFDATTVAAVASKVLTQSVLLGAQIAGVPVATASTGSSGGEALSRSSAELATVDASLAAREATLTSQRTALRSLARTILGARAQIDAPGFGSQTPAQRAAVHGPIDSSFQAMKPLLSMQVLQ